MRTRMITRTVTFNHIKVMAVNTQTASVENKGLCIVGDYTDKEIEKLVKSELEKMDNIKYVSIVENYKDTQIYGMSEEDFVAKAEIITR